MAIIAPFRGLRYNEQYLGGKAALKDVITPPYDVISHSEREAYRKRSPYNFVHIDLPKPYGVAGETSTTDPYEFAGRLFSSWIKDRVFELDPEPAFYYYEIDYVIPTDNLVHTRKGFFTLLKLEEFHKGCVYPHEKTFSRVKQDRLLLTTACNAHLSPIFALYSDTHGKLIETLKEAATQSPEIVSYTDDQGISHRLWRVTDRATIEFLQKSFFDKDIYIADGHHRYETALAYRNMMREKTGKTDGNEPYEYALMYLSPMEDPGLVILPTHRLMPVFPMERVEPFLEKATEFFDIDYFSYSDEGQIRAWIDVINKEGKAGRNTIGVAFHGRDSLILLKAKTEKVQEFLRNLGTPEELLDIDVVILDSLIFEHLLNIDRSMLEDELKICFSHNTQEALNEVIGGSRMAGFFISPTKIDQVRRVASRCLVMPHKSTYFYPKVVSGLVIYPMDADLITSGSNNPGDLTGSARYACAT